MNKIVWAKFKTCPWWPGKIVEEDDNIDSKSRTVVFYEDKASEPVDCKRIKPYLEHKEKLFKQKLNQAMTLRLRIACSEADSDVSKISNASAHKPSAPGSTHLKDKPSSDMCKAKYKSGTAIKSLCNIKAELSFTPKSNMTQIRAIKSTELPKKTLPMKRLILTPPTSILTPPNKSLSFHNLLSASDRSSLQLDGSSSPKRAKTENVVVKKPAPSKKQQTNKKLKTEQSDNDLAGASHKKPLTSEKSAQGRNKLTKSNCSSGRNVSSINEDNHKVPERKSLRRAQSAGNIKISDISRSRGKRGGHSVSTRNLHTSHNTKLPAVASRYGTNRSESTPNEFKLSEPPPDPVDTPSSPIAQSSQKTSSQESVSNNDPSVAANPDSDDELPSYDYILKGPEFNASVGEVVWAKFRSYPQWPCLITRINAKQAAIKWINSENIEKGLWVPRRGISAYPGDHYFDYVSQAEKSQMHHIACSTAIKMADRYLNEVADGRDISGFDYFFPGQAEEQLLSEDDDIASSGDETIVCTVEQSPVTEQDNVYTTLKPKIPFSDHTVIQIQEREEWLKKVLESMQDDRMVLETYVREGEAAHEAVTDQKLCLGPFSLSQEDLGDAVMQLMISAYKSVTGTIHIPNWCYNSILPKAIINAISKVDNTTSDEAKAKYFSDMMTAEEDDRYQEQLRSAARNVDAEQRASWLRYLENSTR